VGEESGFELLEAARAYAFDTVGGLLRLACFISAFSREASVLLGGRITEPETGRFESLRVPPALKERDHLIGRTDPVPDRYARVTFDKSLIVGKPQAELVAPDRPLHDAVLERPISNRLAAAPLSCLWA
jgi:hypothetical protein